ncbi:transposase domain-containing protein (plasmid) [Rhizobium sp. T1470]
MLSAVRCGTGVNTHRKSRLRFASLIGTCKMNGVEPHAYLCDLFTRLAHGHLAKDIDALMPWAYAARIKASQ